jgi:hypothetical protein
MTEHSVYVRPAPARHFGPMSGWEWKCSCGAKGTPTYGKSKSEERGEAHAIRAKAAEEGPQQEH